VIEASFNKAYYIIFIKIFILSLILSNEEIDIIEKNYLPIYSPICKNICFETALITEQNNPYIGLNWIVSHNMMIIGKTSLINKNSNDDIILHNIIGGNLSLKETEDSKYIFSIAANKLRHTENGNYTWIQSSLIYIRKVRKYSFQLIIDQIHKDNYDNSKINFICGRNIFNNVFLYLGINKSLSSNVKPLNYFLSLSFNI